MFPFADAYEWLKLICIQVGAAAAINCIPCGSGILTMAFRTWRAGYIVHGSAGGVASLGILRI